MLKNDECSILNIGSLVIILALGRGNMSCPVSMDGETYDMPKK
jgi:hypothetical protein